MVWAKLLYCSEKQACWFVAQWCCERGKPVWRMAAPELSVSLTTQLADNSVSLGVAIHNREDLGVRDVTFASVATSKFRLELVANIRLHGPNRTSSGVAG